MLVCFCLSLYLVRETLLQYVGTCTVSSSFKSVLCILISKLINSAILIIICFNLICSLNRYAQPSLH